RVVAGAGDRDRGMASARGRALADDRRPRLRRPARGGPARPQAGDARRPPARPRDDPGSHRRAAVRPDGTLPGRVAGPDRERRRGAPRRPVAGAGRRPPRDHLLRALTPLYLGRVAAFVVEARATPLARIPESFDKIDRAFEVEKEHLVARWR